MIKIVADTTCCLPRDGMDGMGIPYLPQIIIFGDETFRDDTEMDTTAFLKKLRASSALPKTAAPPPALYRPVFEKFIAEGATIIVITPSSDLSGTTRSAEVAALEFPKADIRVIDVRTVAGGLGSIVTQAHEWAQQGMDADSLVKKIKEMAEREQVLFYVDTLEYLHKGGRIGGAQALLGSILQVKPLLTLKDGRIETVESQRTKKRALGRLRDLVCAGCPKSPDAHLTVLHGDAEAEAKELAGELSAFLGIMDIPIYELPPAILVHAGPGPIEVSYFK